MRKIFILLLCLGLLAITVNGFAEDDNYRAKFGQYKIYMFLDLKTGALCYMNYESISCQHYTHYSTQDNEVGREIQEYRERGGQAPHIVMIPEPPPDEQPEKIIEKEMDEKL